MTEEELKRQMELETFKMKAQGRIAMMGAVASFEQFALKTVFILNGGALIAVLGTLSTRQPSYELLNSQINDLRQGLWLWIGGLVISATAVGCGYVAQQRFYEGDPTFANLTPVQKGRKDWQAKFFRRVTVASAILALLAFASGCLHTANGLL